MKILSKFCIGLCCLSFFNSGFTQSGDAGATGLAFLKAYVAVSNDATSLFWNPAGLSYIKGSEVAFTHTEWLQDISHDFLAFAFAGLGGGMGVSVYTGSIDGIERRTIPSPDPLGSVDARDLALTIGYARQVNADLRVGIGIRYLYEKIYVDEASGYAFDVGASYRPFESPLQIAGVIQNIGRMGDLRNDSIKLPTTFRFGAAYSIDLREFDGGLLFSADAVKVVENSVSGNFGVEVSMLAKLAFRFGYQTGTSESAFAGGFGLQFNRVNLDYGYKPFDSELGDTHRFSFRFKI